MIQPDEIIRSKRKTLAISIDAFGKLTVRAPMACSKERIFDFLQQKSHRCDTLRWLLLAILRLFELKKAVTRCQM